MDRSRHALSRWTGLGVLLVCLVVHVSLPADLEAPWRRAWFDTMQQLQPRERPADPPAIVVAIDESSIRAFGQWPWPRDNLALLISRLKDSGVSAIGVDIMFAEPDRLSPRALGRWIGGVNVDLGERVADLGDTDAELAEALRMAHVVLPVSGIGADAIASENNLGRAPAVVLENVESDRFTRFDAALRATPRLQTAAESQAAIAFDGLPDGIVRRIPALQMISETPFNTLGGETLRVGRQAFLTLVTPGTLGLTVDIEAYRFPVERDGTFWLHFGKARAQIGVGADEDPRYIPAAQIMQGNVGAEHLADKIVLLAVTGLGTVDSQTTPLAEEVWGIEAHLQMIEQIVDQRFLRRPFEMFLAETLVIGLFGILLIQIVPRAVPGQSLAVATGGIAAIIGISVLAFKAGWLVDASAPALGGSLTAAALIATGLIERDRERLLERAARETEEKARGLLLEAAASMQRSVLPSARFAIEGRVSLAAHLTPSFEVGGDLYDHFMLDEHRLFLLVGDVSGKGIAACQFMGISKRLWKIVAQKMATGIDKIQAEANTQIATDNSETLFVTGIAAIIDLETLMLSVSSAGHDMPILLRGAEPPRQLDEATGPPAGLMADFPYPMGEVQLAPGDRLILFSDGISEALDARREAYGIHRLVDCLAGADTGASPQQIVDAVCDDVRTFVDGAEQSDDLTLMVVALA